MGGVLNILSLIPLALKRLKSEPGLTLGTLLGLVTAVALTVSVPMYTEAANNRLLREELSVVDESLAIPFMFRAVNQSGELRRADLDAADRLLSDYAPAIIRLPLQESSLSVQSDYFGLYPSSEGYYSSRRTELGRMKLGCVRRLADHVTLLEGRWPGPISADLGEPLEVLITESKAAETGLQVGEELTLFRGIETTGREQVPVRIVGIWRPSDPDACYWFLAPKIYDQVMLMPEESYIFYASSQAEASHVYLNYLAWYQLYDGSSLTADDVPGILRGISVLKARLNPLAPSISLSVSPEDALRRHQRAVTLQTNLLLASGLPVIALVLFFSGFISTVAARRRAGEVAMLRSRGYGIDHVLVLSTIQSLILGGVSLMLGLLLGRLVAGLLGNTRSFLSFTTGAPLPVRITPASVRTGLAVSILALLLCVLPDFKAAKLTAVIFWQRAARMTGRSWWQRYYLDLILLAASGYGYYVLSRGEGLAFLIGGKGSPLQNPLVLITPSLLILVSVMVFLRLVPLLFRLMAWAGSLTSSTVLVLVLRHLERRSSHYNGVLLLLTLSVSLSLFTASMAWTLDKNLIDRAYYQVGADMSLDEMGWVGASASSVSISSPTSGTGPGASAGSADTILPTIVPVDEVYDIPDVRAAMRLYKRSVSIRVGRGPVKGTLVAVERTRLPDVAFFRPDFSSQSLGALMNSLALDRQGVLVDPEFLEASSLNIGDGLVVQLHNAEATKLDFNIVGALNLFPTVYKEEFPLLLANIDYVMERIGWPMPGEIWLSVTPEADANVVVQEMEGLGFHLRNMQDARGMVTAEQSQLLRVGLFGFLSVGFIATSGLSMLSLMIYSFTSFQQRYIQFGILHAVGLSKGQLETVFVLEQGFLILLGILVGTGLGFVGCSLFLPFFQVSTTQVQPLPPLQVEIALHDMWKTFAVLGVALLVLAAGTLRLLQSLRTFTAIKLGTHLTG